MAKLYLKFEQAVLKEITLTQGALTIGRLPDNSLQIDNLAVSGHHAKVYWDQDHYTVEDLGSLNGTYVNSQKIGNETGVDLRVVHLVVLQDLLGRVHGLGLEHAGDHEKIALPGCVHAATRLSRSRRWSAMRTMSVVRFTSARLMKKKIENAPSQADRATPAATLPPTRRMPYRQASVTASSIIWRLR